MMRASLAIALVLPAALTACPALLSDWTMSGSGATDAGDAGAGAHGNGGGGSGGAHGLSNGTGGSVSSGGMSSGGGETISSGGTNSGGTAGTGGAGGSPCTAGTKQCNALVPETCNSSGAWVDDAACPFACSAGVCIDGCTPGTKQCSNNGVQICSTSGDWGTETACTSQACVSGICTGVCVPSTTRCSANGVQPCGASGQYGTPVACTNQACVGGACTGVCTPGAQQCNSVTPQTCDANGVWQNGTVCTNVCSGGACSGTCSPGAKRCNGQVTQSCDGSGTWQDGATCTSSPCVNGACTRVCPSGLPGPKLVPVSAPQADAYCIDATEVTNADYAAFLSASGANTSGQDPSCKWNTTFVPNANWPQSNNLPVVFVNWCDASAYCSWAGKRLCGKPGGGPAEYGSSSDASADEWFNACSKGGTLAYPYGNTYVGQTCNGADSGIGALSPVGSLDACQGGYSGVFDLSGNVFEWEASCATTAGATDLCRLRGGSFESSSANLGCDNPDVGHRQDGGAHIGFRCCGTP